MHAQINKKQNLHISEHTYKKYSQKDSETKYKWDIVWSNVILLGFMHLCALYGAYVKYTTSFYWSTSIFIKFLAYSSGIAVTAGAHRLWSHKTYKANSALQILLMILMSCTYQNSIYIWCRDHRAHHKFSETDADPHNSNRGLFFSHMGWLLIRKHPDCIEKGKTVDMSDLQQNKIVMFQHRYYNLLVIFLSFIIPAFVPWYFFGEHWKVAVFYGAFYRYVYTVNVTWGINSLAHFVGYKPYDTSIGAVENTIMMVGTFGEGFHNYHHTFPYDYRASEFDIDIRNSTTMVIDSFAKIGWVSDRQKAQKELIKKRAIRSGDGTINADNCDVEKPRYIQFLHALSLALFISTL